MFVIPSIDLRDGAAVQLVGGNPDDERVRDPDPVARARAFVDAGAEWLHVVDLDRALGKGSNMRAIARILDAVSDRCRVQVGGGVRFTEDVDACLDAGAARVIVGTRAVTDEMWLDHAAKRYGERLVIAVDARGDEIVVKGWTEGSGHSLTTFAKRAAALGVGGLLYTDVGREGQLGGANVDGVRALVDAVPETPVLASGGVRSIEDLNALADAGAWGTVIGMALYTGRIDFKSALDAFRQEGA